MTASLSAKNLFKLFGPEPERAYELLDQGYAKDQLLEETGVTVGVNDVSFDIHEGEIFVVMGLSGSGKSTLVRMLNRLIEPSRGKVWVNGEEITEMSRRELIRVRRQSMGMVFQHFALLPHQTVVENAAFGLKIRGVSRDERNEKAHDALERVGLKGWAQAMTGELSGGMQQRVGLARALAADPQILLMDEPFSALDPLIRREMQQELLELQREVKKTIVFITHDFNEALMLGDRIAIMKEGRFEQVGTAADLVSQPATDYVTAFVQDIDRSRVYTAAKLVQAAPVLSLANDTPDTAASKFSETETEILYVTDQDQRPRGFLRSTDLGEANSPNGHDLEAYLQTDFPTCSDDTFLVDTYGHCAAGVPVAVTDESGKLVGVLDPLDVFNELASATSSSSDTPDRPTSQS